MMYNIVFSPEAIKDLEETKAYITEELCNEQAATKTVSKILKDIRMLSEFPESGPSLSATVNFDTNYRFLACGNYVTFYHLEENEVRIVRILYGRRNFMQILFGEPQE